MRYLIALTLFVPLALMAQEQSAPAATPVTSCTDDAYRQFDFWIGDWEVSSNDQPAGTNSIRPILGGCALQENWQGTGPGGLSGKSFNIYDLAGDRWHQTWVDSSGTLLELNGGLIDGNMVLEGKRPRRDGNGTTEHRITWTPNEDGSVRQYWEASRDNGVNWNVLFDGLYVPREQTP